MALELAAEAVVSMFALRVYFSFTDLAVQVKRRMKD